MPVPSARERVVPLKFLGEAYSSLALGGGGGGGGGFGGFLAIHKTATFRPARGVLLTHPCICIRAWTLTLTNSCIESLSLLQLFFFNSVLNYTIYSSGGH